MKPHSHLTIAMQYAIFCAASADLKLWVALKMAL